MTNWDEWDETENVNAKELERYDKWAELVANIKMGYDEAGTQKNIFVSPEGNDATEDEENWITNSKVWGSVNCGAKFTCLHFVRVARVGGIPTGAIIGTNKITAGDE